MRDIAQIAPQPGGFAGVQNLDPPVAEHRRQPVAAVGHLPVQALDPQEGRAAPIYILDAATYEVVSTIRPKEDLGIELADHIHNTVWYEHDGTRYLICQAWNPGYYFVLELVE